MHIVSYRGPGQSGGVSAALNHLWNSYPDAQSAWWYLDNNYLEISRAHQNKERIAQIPEDVVKGHYRFCNQFLWPVMHEFPEHANYVPSDFNYYQSFNESYAWCIMRSNFVFPRTSLFIQDYQLAMIPAYVKTNTNMPSIVFWHIPWPKHVQTEHTEPLVAIAKTLLNAKAIGFHTTEYASNFLRFVDEYLPGNYTNRHNLTVTSESAPIRSLVTARSRRHKNESRMRPTHSTRLIVAPLGIDYQHWSTLAAASQTRSMRADLPDRPFILSVDRADYTKGLDMRIRAIDLFFQNYPGWINKIVFAQIASKTRVGLPVFEEYWRYCQKLNEQLKERWHRDNWKPLIWIDTPYTSEDLAGAYASASVMLINAMRDGLNLTAKEYVACQSDTNPGVLILSKGTGAWNELGNNTVGIVPSNLKQTAAAVNGALSMDLDERKLRMTQLKAQVSTNTLKRWCHVFKEIADGPVTDALDNTSA